MRKYIIQGNAKLKGTIDIQYSKNIAMKLIQTPLIQEGIYRVKNVPRITSIFNLIELLELYGCKTKWLNDHDLEIDSNNIRPETVIPDNIFSHTSGAILAVQIIVGRFGKAYFEKLDLSNIGGDNIGSRAIEITTNNLKQFNVALSIKENNIILTKTNNHGFEYHVPDQSYGFSVGAIYSALCRDTPSKLYDVTTHADFEIIIRNLKNIGCQILKDSNNLTVYPIKQINSKVDIINQSDLHDFATFVSLGISTESEITLNNFNYDYMCGALMEDYLTRLNVKYKIDNSTFFIKKNEIVNLRPIDIVAYTSPSFITEWQVLFSPILTQIKGFSNIVELWFDNRLGHWEDLKKMGAKWNYYPNKQNRKNMPFAIRIEGGNKLTGTSVEAKDLRGGAALLIAGLIANGTTTLSGVEHIERGYENLVNRINKLGANIEIIDN